MAADRADLASPWLLRQLGIERSEAWLVFCGAACLFAVGWVDVSLANVSMVFFNTQVGVENLPYAFLASSALLVVTGVALCLTVIGIPLGIGSFKMVPISLLPLGREIVPTR